MNMTILTQNDVFLNYDHIIAIRVYSGEVSLDNGKTIAAYQVVADLSMPILNLDETENAQEAPQTQIELGVYFDEGECQNAARALSEWLNNADSRPHLFKIPMANSISGYSDTNAAASKLEYRPDEDEA